MVATQKAAPKQLAGDELNAYFEAMKLANWISYDLGVLKAAVADPKNTPGNSVKNLQANLPKMLADFQKLDKKYQTKELTEALNELQKRVGAPGAKFDYNGADAKYFDKDIKLVGGLASLARDPVLISTLQGWINYNIGQKDAANLHFNADKLNTLVGAIDPKTYAKDKKVQDAVATVSYLAKTDPKNLQLDDKTWKAAQEAFNSVFALVSKGAKGATKATGPAGAFWEDTTKPTKLQTKQDEAATELSKKQIQAFMNKVKSLDSDMAAQVDAAEAAMGLEKGALWARFLKQGMLMGEAIGGGYAGLKMTPDKAAQYFVTSFNAFWEDGKYKNWSGEDKIDARMFADISLGMYNAYRGENYLTSLVKMVNDGKTLEDYAKTAFKLEANKKLYSRVVSRLMAEGKALEKEAKPVAAEEEEESEQPAEQQLTFGGYIEDIYNRSSSNKQTNKASDEEQKLFALYALMQGHSGPGDPLQAKYLAVSGALTDEKFQQFVNEDGTVNAADLLAAMQSVSGLYVGADGLEKAAKDDAALGDKMVALGIAKKAGGAYSVDAGKLAPYAMKNKEGEPGEIYSKEAIMQAATATKEYVQSVQAALPAYADQYGDKDEFKTLLEYTVQMQAMYNAGREPRQTSKTAYLNAVSAFETLTGKKLVEQPKQTEKSETQKTASKERTVATEAPVYAYAGELKGKVDWADRVLSTQLAKLKGDVGDNADAKIRVFVEAASLHPEALPAAKPADAEKFIVDVINAMGTQQSQ